MNLRNAGSILGNLLTIRHDAFETVMMHAIVSDVIIDVAETNIKLQNWGSVVFLRYTIIMLTEAIWC